ncbi:MAG: HAD-IB family hydrolase [Candidatus Pacebacteria bacterium]|nr:HAD-IB family hydrolase [Candidatus Paceibacterota bacterium]
MKKVAIFDIDGTIFRSSLLIELVEDLIEQDIFPVSAEKYYKEQFKAWLDREGTYDDYINGVIDAFRKNLKGVAYKDFIDIAKDVVEEQKNHVYRYTRDMVANLKEQGYFLLAISQSPRGILNEFCEELGFDKVYGRFYELGPTDCFTGEIVDIHLIGNKANIVKRAVEKNDLTLEGSIGVGDTEGDVSLLEMVEHPICFNPNKALYKIAKRNGWEVVVERKDVIYKIQNGNVI